MTWNVKLIISILVDIFDMTIGRLLFSVPFSGEIIGVAIGMMLFGSKGLWYFLEAFDPTEQIDGFIPSATMIALSAKDD